jgi:hypothetical protein
VNPNLYAIQNSLALAQQANPSAFSSGEEAEYVQAIQSGVQLTPDQLAAAARYGITPKSVLTSGGMSTTTKVLLFGGLALVVFLALRNR